MSDKVKYRVEDVISTLQDFLKPDNNYDGYVTDVMMDDILDGLAIPCEPLAPYKPLED